MRSSRQARRESTLDDETVTCAAGVFGVRGGGRCQSTGFLNGLDDIGASPWRARQGGIDAFESSGAADRGPVTTAL